MDENGKTFVVLDIAVPKPAKKRIRDKFTASRARGMWMGGKVPLGYDVLNRKLW